MDLLTLNRWKNMKMKLSLHSALFHTSGVNSSFHGNGGYFQDYIQHMQNVIATGRIDLTAEKNRIINANSPYEMRPATMPAKKGILLIHGLYDSPYTLRDIAEHLVRQGFLVRSILLPGHGTVPGDMLNIHYTAWLQATHFAAQQLIADVPEAYILGYSMGGTLATHFALQHQDKLKGLLLFAPALKTRRKFVKFLAWLHKLGSLFSPRQNWYQLELQTSHVRYESFTCNAALQGMALMDATQRLIKTKRLNLPLFMVLSEDDESISQQAALNFFTQNNNELNELLLYSNNPNHFTDKRITIRPSALMAENIIDLAHTGLPIAPDNPHYGKNGEFKDFQHYHYDLSKRAEPIYFGSLSKNNLKKYTLQRLSYNPDFSGMMDIMSQFLKKVSD